MNHKLKKGKFLNKQKIFYHINIEKPQTQTINVTLKFDISDLKKIKIQMPVWTPGSYKIRDFSRNVSNELVKIDGKSVKFKRVDKCTWEIDNFTSGKEIEFNYDVYAHEMTVRTSFVDHTQAILNGASIFVYCPNGKENDIQLNISYPDSWKNIVTGLQFDENKDLFFANNYDELIDTPILIGNSEIYDFKVDKTPHQFVIVGQGNYEIKPILKDTVTIISKFKEIFGDLPYDKYVFITHLYDNQYGGLEHLNSCHIVYDRWQFKDRNKYIKFISLVAHEYFHTFNVKRIRPIELGPFNYQTEHYSKMLWLAEGVTSYYDEYILKRAGIIDIKEYFELLNSNFTRYFNIPGRSILSTKDSSFLAWIKLYIPDENFINNGISYYLSGGLITLVMDLKIRELTNSKKSLDDVYKLLWQKFKVDGKGIKEQEFFNFCKDICGNELKEIQDYLNEPKEVDFESAFEPFGIKFTPTHKKDDEKEASWLGIQFDVKDKLIFKFVKSHGPAYLADLSPGDELIAVNKSRVTVKNRDNLLSSLSTKYENEFLINRMGDIIKLNIRPEKQQFNKFDLVRVENPTESQKHLFENWLNCKWEDK